jgi:predicted nucleic acid-binding protein
MILVDSSVWIDFFRGKSTRQTDRLDWLLDSEPIAIGDLILVEVLQGFVPDRDFQRAKALLAPLVLIELGGADIARRAAANFRKLRSAGATVRKTIDTVIATRCIEDRYTLLHSDKDFEPFVRHLGLRSVF